MNAPGAGQLGGKVGPYRLARLLGSGGMGVVYLGHHLTTGAAAAIKLIRPEHAADPTFRARLRREVSVAQQVPRFCTAPVLDADIDADPPWVATEYIDAPTLDVALLSGGPLSGAGLETFAIGVAVALRAIHAHGVIHRDLKPSNVLMSPPGPRVIDFGIARPTDPAAQFTHITHAGHAVGTPTYMAPELLTGGPLTPAVDVYAWGRLISYAATGRPPATGVGPNPGQPTEPDLDGLPEPLRGLVHATLHPDPAARPTAAQLLDQLTVHQPAALSALTSPVPPLPVPAPLPVRVPLPRPAGGWSPARTAAVVSVLAVVTVVAVVAAAATLVRLWPDRPDAGGPGPQTAGGAGTASPAGPAADLPPFGLQLVGPLDGHQGSVEDVALGTLNGAPIAVSGGQDETVRVWDLTTGHQIGEPLTGHSNGVRAVAVGDLDGTPIAVSTGYDRTVRVWDLAAGEPIGEPFTGHEGAVWGVALGELGGVPIAVTGSIDETLRIWDLATGQLVGEPIPHRGSVYSVALTELDGAPVVVSGGQDYSVQVRDLATGELVRGPLRGHAERIHSLAVGQLDGGPIAVTGAWDNTVRVWDLTAGRQLGQPLRGHTDHIYAVAAGELDGVPIAASGALDYTVQVWDLTTGQPLDRPLTRHTGGIDAVAIGELDGIPVAVTGSHDGTIRVSALTSAGG